MGYYDTLKIINNYDGYNFIFKNYSKWVYNILARKVDKELLKKCKRYFRAKDNKELIIKALEYTLIKEDLTYFNIYSIFKQIRYVKKKTNKKHFVYDFVKSLRIL